MEKQKHIIKWKIQKNNLNDKYMLKLMEKVGEPAEVIRKNKRMEKGASIKGTIEKETLRCSILYSLFSKHQ